MEYPAMYVASVSLQNGVDLSMNELEQLKLLIKQVYEAKGRYHTQLAMCALYDAVGLPNVKPK